MPCFLAGVSAARAFVFAGGLPLVETTHQQGPCCRRFIRGRGRKACLSARRWCSMFGGTTDLLLLQRARQHRCIGTSNDLYAGQAVDRIG